MSSIPLIDLPARLLLAIGSHLDMKSALSLAATSKTLQRTLSSEAYWLGRPNAMGLGIPDRHARSYAAEEYCKFLWKRCQTCKDCRDAWRSALITVKNIGSAFQIIEKYSMAINRPIRAPYHDSADPFEHVHTTRSAVYGIDDHLIFQVAVWLDFHPLSESGLISIHPIPHLNWIIERGYTHLDSAGRKVYPTWRNLWRPEKWHTESIPGGVLANPFGITIGDVLATLKDRLQDSTILAGPTTLQYFELRAPGELVVVLGSRRAGSG